MRLLHPVLVAFACLLVPALAAAARAPAPPPSEASAAAPRIAPPPAWVAPPDPIVPREGRDAVEGSAVASASASAAAGRKGAPDGGADGASVDALVDHQIRVGASVEHYVHVARRVTSIAGVETAGQIRIAFDPSYERVTLHAVRLLRGDAAIDALATATLRSIQRERGLDEQIYDGALTLLVVLDDVRVGDVVDLAYTIDGENPVFGGRFVEAIALGGGGRIERLRVRLVAPASRAIAYGVSAADGAALAPSVRTRDDVREIVWERRDVPAASREDGAPSWVEPTPRLFLSEMRSWGDVAAWALPLYEEAARSSPAVAAQVRAIARREASQEEQARAALRFVQDEVRYLGIELGAHSHRPHAADSVLARRFGDCKDKAVLLVALLRGLGVEAHPALVSTTMRAHLVDRLPSAYAFDHVVVTARLGDRDVWIDPTRSLERGPVGAVPLPYGRALVIAPGTSELATIEAPAPTAPTIDAHEVFAVHAGETALDVTTTYRAGDATSMRQRLASAPRSTIQQDFLDYYASLYPRVELASDLAVTDDEASGVLVVRERYALHDAWPDGALHARAITLRGVVERPRVTRRQTPFAVPFPLFVRHTIEVRGAEVQPPDDVGRDDETLTFAARGERRSDGATIVFELRTKGDAVAPKRIAAHVAAVDAVLGATDLALAAASDEPPTVGVATVDPVATGGSLLVLACVGGVAVIGGAIGAVPRTIRRLRWRRAAKRSSGETPALAIAAAGRDAATRTLEGVRCACGAAPARPAEGAIAWSTIVFGERTLDVARVACGACGERHVRYFALPPRADDPRA